MTDTELDAIVAGITDAVLARVQRQFAPLFTKVDGLTSTKAADPTACDPYCDDIVELYEDDGRWLVRRFFRRGVLVKELRHQTATVLDRGVWESGREYQRGDATTWGGSLFIAQQATTAKPGEPGEASRAWRLSVKRGGEGKPGRDGRDLR